MVTSSKPSVDPCSGSEQDISETSTLTETQDVYESVPVPSRIRGAPTNYLRVSKRGFHKREDVAIQGQYYIDLSILPVPQSVLHVVSGTENLFLYTKCGVVIADVWVTGNNKLRQVFMKLHSEDGNVRANVHDAFSDGEREHRPSLNIDLLAINGKVSLSLPRWFRGLMTIKSSQRGIMFSPTLEERTALVSDVQNICVYFVGDRPRSWRWRNDDDNDEEGPGANGYEEELDKLFVGAEHQGVEIRWEGELELPR